MLLHGSNQYRQQTSWMQRPGMVGAVARFWNRSYAPDYLGLALLITAYALVRGSTEHKQHFDVFIR